MSMFREAPVVLVRGNHPKDANALACVLFSFANFFYPTGFCLEMFSMRYQFWSSDQTVTNNHHLSYGWRHRSLPKEFCCSQGKKFSRSTSFSHSPYLGFSRLSSWRAYISFLRKMKMRHWHGVLVINQLRNSWMSKGSVARHLSPFTNWCNRHNR